MKIGISMIAGDMMHTWTAYDLIHIVNYTSEALGHDVILNRGEGTLLHAARQDACKRLVDKGCDYIFVIDSDMRVPVNTIQGLMAHDVPVVAANCSKRKRPVGPTARRKNAWLHMDEHATEAVFPDPDVTGIELVETVGFGVILIKAEVFKKIEWPWFDQPWVEEAQKHVGEDTFFCGRCHEAGIPIYIDHDLSWVVKHTGLHDYGAHDIVAERDHDMRVEAPPQPDFAGV